MTDRTEGAHLRNGRGRVDSVDVLRGVVMVLMALDHTRDFFGDASVSPTNLATTTAPQFFTRWITHFCAPTFFLLTGVGAYLALRRRTPTELSRFLLTRGLWLVLLELTVLRFLWQFNADYKVLLLTVFWALGWSMVALAGLVRLPVRWVAAIGLAMIVLHDLADRIAPTAFGALGWAWHILHVPGPLYMSPSHVVFVAYPLIPWIGVMAVGFSLGRVFDWTPDRRRAFLLRAGLGITATFVLLRTLNVYGDPVPWSAQRSSAFTLLSFLNTNKYPPSLLFLLMTLGPALLLLRLADRRTPMLLRPAETIGRVPLFYFVTHVLVLHLMAMGASLIRYGGVHWMIESPTLDRFPVTQPPGWPAPLPVVHLVWLTAVLLLYPACRWYAAVKARRPGGWLSYF
ncbi:MAG: DUF1624 domain-containing protein [Gemmatimonadaceae bacterium]|nr:DUF1624 domain-containing protein [Gemmatimonadaceae bacterium]